MYRRLTSAQPQYCNTSVLRTQYCQTIVTMRLLTLALAASLLVLAACSSLQCPSALTSNLTEARPACVASALLASLPHTRRGRTLYRRMTSCVEM